MSSLVSVHPPRQFPVLGVNVDLLEGLNDYVDWLIHRIRMEQGTHVVTLNAEMTMQAQINAELGQIIHNAELVVPDGAGIVLYLKLYGQSIHRCPGVELSEALLRKVATVPNASVFFYGGAPGVVEKAAQRWQQECPNLTLAGVAHGYVQGDEQVELTQRLQALQPSLIFVGLGVPRQEHWIAQHRALCPQAVWIGVGGSFDIWSGTKQRAPQWLCDHNLEWTYRLYQEPWRWRRMMALPEFAWQSLIERFTPFR
ncbi:WecB/TagA/CpsF family glycosyltransferase [Lyngbya confervoides]|uniref:WecB/TagA/CpsF family glycosyltransferase n=1 Tax=Lyngbya confervoides BDU141951 TaxID=1574623 RepID=A0ABD4T3H3_9CYAN|nr:WecB/TagA/CpsF family glycosyltransferase [Lyngbya confervoides]MCM1983129.1 WecB/TagA/CpsF family glycosyltransferase [Lyngbya confervoides BDU141951]